MAMSDPTCSTNAFDLVCHRLAHCLPYSLMAPSELKAGSARDDAKIVTAAGELLGRPAEAEPKCPPTSSITSIR